MTGAGRPLLNSCGPGLPSAFLEVFMTENAFWPNPTTSSPALPLLHPFFCNDGAARCPLWATEVAHVQWRQEARISGLDPPPRTTTTAWSWDWRPCCLSGASAGTLCTRFGDGRFLPAGAHFPSFPPRIPHFDVHSSLLTFFAAFYNQGPLAIISYPLTPNTVGHGHLITPHLGSETSFTIRLFLLLRKKKCFPVLQGQCYHRWCGVIEWPATFLPL